MRSNLRLLVPLILGISCGLNAATLTTTQEQNEPNTFLWSGYWTFAPNQNVAEQTIYNPTGDPNETGGLLGPGPWSVTLTVVKGYENGNNTYKMTFTGKHNPDGASAEYKYRATEDDDLDPGNKPVTLSHGSAKDQWIFDVLPEAPANGKIKWVVRASHVVPEPSSVAAVAGVGLLIFGFVRRVRARPPGN